MAVTTAELAALPTPSVPLDENTPEILTATDNLPVPDDLDRITNFILCHIRS